MIDWTDEAIEAAIDAFYEGHVRRNMRAALDAAVKAQGIDETSIAALLSFDAGVEQGRAEAFEEAAKVADDNAKGLGMYRDTFAAAQFVSGVAAAIRNLAKEPLK